MPFSLGTSPCLRLARCPALCTHTRNQVCQDATSRPRHNSAGRPVAQEVAAGVPSQPAEDTAVGPRGRWPKGPWQQGSPSREHGTNNCVDVAQVPIGKIPRWHWLPFPGAHWEDPKVALVALPRCKLGRSGGGTGCPPKVPIGKIPRWHWWACLVHLLRVHQFPSRLSRHCRQRATPRTRGPAVIHRLSTS